MIYWVLNYQNLVWFFLQYFYLLNNTFIFCVEFLIAFICLCFLHTFKHLFIYSLILLNIHLIILLLYIYTNVLYILYIFNHSLCFLQFTFSGGLGIFGVAMLPLSFMLRVFLCWDWCICFCLCFVLKAI